MTSDVAYRNLAQKVRQTARAQLMEIRAARQAQLGDEEAGDGVRRRRRKPDRMTRPAQDARMQAAIAAGRVELWDAPPDPPSQVTDDCPVLVDAGAVTMWEAALRPGIPDPTAAEPEAEPEMFGPPWDPLAAQADAADKALHTEEIDPPAEAFFGPHLPPTDPSARTDVDRLTLSAGMRIGSPPADPAPEAPPVRAPTLNWAGLDAALTVTPNAVRHDLTGLPGVGPGLIWMLQKCGISTLQDLAETDAATLGPKLGLVGQIVDVQGWLSYAQHQVGHRP